MYPISSMNMLWICWTWVFKWFSLSPHACNYFVLAQMRNKRVSDSGAHNVQDAGAIKTLVYQPHEQTIHPATPAAILRSKLYGLHLRLTLKTHVSMEFRLVSRFTNSRRLRLTIDTSLPSNRSPSVLERTQIIFFLRNGRANDDVSATLDMNFCPPDNRGHPSILSLFRVPAPDDDHSGVHSCALHVLDSKGIGATQTNDDVLVTHLWTF